MSQPPIVGPIAGAKVAVTPNSASPIGCFDGGSLRSTIVIAVGMSTPPVKPWPARNRIICGRLVDSPHSIEKTRNSDAVHDQVAAQSRTCRESQPVSGIDDDLGDQIGGRDPASLVERGGEAALDVG